MSDCFPYTYCMNSNLEEENVELFDPLRISQLQIEYPVLKQLVPGQVKVLVLPRKVQSQVKFLVLPRKVQGQVKVFVLPKGQDKVLAHSLAKFKVTLSFLIFLHKECSMCQRVHRNNTKSKVKVLIFSNKVKCSCTSVQSSREISRFL